MLLRVTQLVEPDGLTLYPMAAGQSDYPELVARGRRAGG
jgi:hypothetical protein